MINETKKSYFGLILQYWAQVLSLATILTSIVGIWSANRYYSRFHVNYLELAELNDFIKHVISRPYLTLVLVTLTITISVYIYLFYRNNNIESKLKKHYTNQHNVKKIKFKLKYRIKDAAAIIGQSLLLWVISTVLLFLITKLESSSLKSTEFTLYNVDTDTKPITCTSYIGRINVNHVFWDRRINGVIIIPSSSIKRMTYVTSLDNRPTEFTADNQVRTNEYTQWQKHIKQICGEDFDIPVMK